MERREQCAWHMAGLGLSSLLHRLALYLQVYSITPGFPVITVDLSSDHHACPAILLPTEPPPQPHFQLLNLKFHTHMYCVLHISTRPHTLPFMLPPDGLTATLLINMRT